MNQSVDFHLGTTLLTTTRLPSLYGLRPPQGTQQCLLAANVMKVQTFHGLHYRPEAMRLYVVGHFNSEDEATLQRLQAIVKSRFGPAKKPFLPYRPMKVERPIAWNKTRSLLSSSPPPLPPSNHSAVSSLMLPTFPIPSIPPFSSPSVRPVLPPAPWPRSSSMRCSPLRS